MNMMKANSIKNYECSGCKKPTSSKFRLNFFNHRERENRNSDIMAFINNKE